MSTDEQIIQLLTEIRDGLREEAAWRQKVINESLRLQRKGNLWQRIGLFAWGLVVVGAVIALYYYFRSPGR